jgi:hypothetical protein
MIKSMLVAGLLISGFAVFGQSEADDSKKVKYGFNLGINQSNTQSHGALPDNAVLSNNLGFRLGLLADFPIAKYLSFSPKTELSFNNSKVDFTNGDGSQTAYEIMPVGIDVMAHFVFKEQNQKWSPYFFLGPNFKIPVTEKNTDPTSYSTNPDFAIDFGIGFDRAFTHFHLAPELRYSCGLLNVNQNPTLQNLNFHNISLVFNFLG